MHHISVLQQISITVTFLLLLSHQPLQTANPSSSHLLEKAGAKGIVGRIMDSPEHGVAYPNV